MDRVIISYHGHACFSLEYQGYRIVLDPYRHGMVPGLPELNLEADAVYCSHEHGDHNYVQAVNLREDGEKPTYTVDKLTVPHDDVGGTKRGMNTVHIFRFGDLRVAHLGDIGCLPDEALLHALQGVDCLLIPVGGFYTISAETAAEIIRMVKPKAAVPMHYRTDGAGFDVLSHLHDFVKHWDSVEEVENSFTLTCDTIEQILVIHYKP